jgi:hypothetical protein
MECLCDNCWWNRVEGSEGQERITYKMDLGDTAKLCWWKGIWLLQNRSPWRVLVLAMLELGLVYHSGGWIFQLLSVHQERRKFCTWRSGDRFFFFFTFCYVIQSWNFLSDMPHVNSLSDGVHCLENFKFQTSLGNEITDDEGAWHVVLMATWEMRYI